jgi:prevent-host-death family protein
MPLTAARTGIAGAARRAYTRDEPTVLTEHGAPVAVVIGIDEWRELTDLRRKMLWVELRKRQHSSAWVGTDEVIAGREW